MILSQAANVHHHGLGLIKGSNNTNMHVHSAHRSLVSRKESGLCLRMLSSVIDYFWEQSINSSYIAV